MPPPPSFPPRRAARAAFCTAAAPPLLGAPGSPRGLRIESFAPAFKRRKPTRRIVACSGSAPRRVAIIGGGLAGLATAYHVLNSTYRVAKKRGADFVDIHVTVYDPGAPGVPRGASAAAAGLLHPFTPRVKKKVWMAEKGLNATLALVSAVQPFADAPLLRAPGIVRLALTPRAAADFPVARRRFPDELQLRAPGDLSALLPDPPGDTHAVLQTGGIVVDTPAYLRALWAACAATGRARHVRRAVPRFEDVLEDHDAVVVCAGAATRAISNFAALPLLACRGQNVRYRARRPSATAHPQLPVIAGKYVIPALFASAPGRLVAGATFEYAPPGASPEEALRFAAGDTPPDLAYAAAALADPLARLAPRLHELYEPDAVSAGVRALPPRSGLGSVPLCAQVVGAPQGKTAWVLTALGSRGLLHHAFLGKMVARSAVGGSDVLIPIDARRVHMDFDTLRGAADLDAVLQCADRPQDTAAPAAAAQ